MVFGLIICVEAIYLWLSRYWSSEFIVDNGDCKYATRNNGWWLDDPTVVLLLAWISRWEEIFKIFTTWKSWVNGHHTETVTDLQQEWSPGPLMISTHPSDRTLLRTCSIGISKPSRIGPTIHQVESQRGQRPWQTMGRTYTYLSCSQQQLYLVVSQ